MNLNELLRSSEVEPRNVLVLRHRPSEPELRKVLPVLAADMPDLFNAYQATQGEKLERAMTKAGYLASFIGHEPGKALFVGLYKIGAPRSLTTKDYWKIPAHSKLQALGMTGFSGKHRQTILWFKLALLDFYREWKGKLVVSWPPPERSWWRRAHRNDIPVQAILEDSALEAAMKDWNEINLTWGQLSNLPKRWQARLAEWRGIYFIFDSLDGKGYVGSAYGASNILGRWRGYARSGHGGNSLLRKRDPESFRFSILQLVSQDTDPEEVIRVENTWKQRLHTRAPYGLNEN